MMETKRRREQRSMLPVHPDAAAIDIGATVHVAAVGPARDPEPVRSFGTFTGDLHRLADWFAQCGIKTVVMESTGVYWIPIYEILEQRGFEVRVVNARDAKHVPGRKTDVSDAAWLQRLHEFGLLRGCFRPQGAIAALRAYWARIGKAKAVTAYAGCGRLRSPVIAHAGERQLERSQSSFTMLFAMEWTTQIPACPITKSAIASVSSPISNDVQRRSDIFSGQPRSR
jgi:hypothetical protein